MRLSPATRVTTQVNVPPLTTAATPLHETTATPERASLTVPLTEIDDEVVEVPLAGEVMATEGGVVSSVMVTLALFVLLLVSVAIAVMLFAPSPLLSVMAAVQALFVSVAGVVLTFTFATATS